MKIKIFTIIILISLSTNMYSQDSLYLSNAINISLENNYNLKITKNTQKIAEINNTWGNTSLMPTLNFALSARENYNMNDKANFRRQSVVPELRLNWLFFNGFSARITKEKFEEIEEQSKGNTAVVIESTIQNVIMAYYNCSMQYEIMTVYKQLAKLSEDRYKRTLAGQNLGVKTSYEGLQAKNAWLQDKSNYMQQEVNYQNSIRTLNYNLAVDDNKNWILSTKLDSIMPDYNIDELSEKLKTNNQTLKNQYINQRLRAKETALAKSKYYPSLSLNAGYNYNNIKNVYDNDVPDMTQNSSNIYAGLSLSFSIFNGGIKKRSVQIACINEETVQISTDQMLHSLSNELIQIYSNYQVLKEIFSLRNEQETAARLNLELSTEKYNSGVINSFNFRDVQIMYSNAAIAKYQALYNLIRSNIALLRITGGIIEEYKK